MAKRALIFVFASYLLFFSSVNCLPNFSTDSLSSSTVAIENNTSSSWKTTNNETLVESESNFNVKDAQKIVTKSCNFEYNPQLLDLLDLSQLRFEKNPESNTSSPLLVFDGSTSISNSNGSYAGLSDGLEKSMALLLKSNNLNSLNATIFQYSSCLEILMIHKNNLSILPVDLFRDLIDLRIITLSENNITHIPSDLFVHNRKLRTVELVNNKANLTKLPSRLFSDFDGLKTVFLQNIGLQELPKDLFWGSLKLKQIDLSKNYLKNLPEYLLRHASNLQFLDLSFNQLTNLPKHFFSAADQLFELDLSNNNFEALTSSDLFVGASSLRILNMENNKLSSLHADAFISLPNLNVAHFAHNHLNLSTGLDGQFGRVSPFHHCPNLTVLNLSHNNVSEMFSDWIQTHTRLHALDLSYNNFSYLEANDLLFQANNLEVNLTHNFIKIVNLTRVRQHPKNPNSNRHVLVDLNDNPLDCYCDAYPLVRYVNWLIFPIYNPKEKLVSPEDLNDVELKVDNLKCHAPENFRGTSLRQLYRANLTCWRSAVCASGGACDCHIEPQVRKLYLNCSGRNLTEAPAWINRWDISRIYVDLSDNALRRAPNMKEGGYDMIQELDLSRNEIDRIGEDFYGTRLSTLDLNYNSLTQIDWNIIRSMWRFTYNLRMRENPWICNDDILAFRNFLKWNWMLVGKWDMMSNFPCNNDTSVTVEYLLHMNSNLAIKRIVVLIVPAVLVIVILYVLFYIIYWSAIHRMRSLRKMKHVGEKVLPTGRVSNVCVLKS